MNYLIAYGSTEGQTKKISEYLEGVLAGDGHYAEVWDTARRMQGVDISSFDAVILAGSVHQKLHQETFANFIVAHRDQLRGLPTFLISVSLAIAFENGEDEATQYVQSLTHYTEFEPDKIMLVGGALKFAEYSFYMNQIVEHVVLEGRDPITDDTEFTEWEALTQELQEFAQFVAQQHKDRGTLDA